jgi:hypothetical protein
MKGSVMANPIERLKSLEQNYPSFQMETGAVIIIDTGDDFITLGVHPDIYEGLAELIDGDYTFPTAKGLIVVTTGWAAPLNANGEVEGMPSEHAQRRRVRLISYKSHEATCSSLSFEDDDEVVYDEGSAIGSLADALTDAWESISA